MCSYRAACVYFQVGAPLEFFSLRRKLFLIPLQEHRNLSQLPNFAFSTALCHFHLSQQEDLDPQESVKQRQEASQMLQDTLIMFPGGETLRIELLLSVYRYLGILGIPQ